LAFWALMCSAAYATLRSFAEVTYSASFRNWAYLWIVFPSHLLHDVNVVNKQTMDVAKLNGYGKEETRVLTSDEE
jgi:hypothetical protein